MPDLLLFFKAFVFSVSASAVTVLASTFLRGRGEPTSAAAPRGSVILLLGFLIGAMTGFAILKFQWVWPPSNALNRFIELILPAIIVVELLACLPQMPRSGRWLLRGIVAAAAGRVLLHGSVYLTADRWLELPTQTGLMLVTGAVSLLVMWRLLDRVAQTPAALMLPFALALSIQAGGAAIMLAGYIKGGAAAIPLAGSLAATTLAGLLIQMRLDFRGLLGVALISLYCLVFVGCCFGALSRPHGILIFFAPCLCLVSRLPVVRVWKNRTAVIVCLTLVCLPLVIVLIQSTIDFRLRMAPLLASHSLQKVKHFGGTFVEQYGDHKRADLSSALFNQDVGTPRARKEPEKLAEES